MIRLVVTLFWNFLILNNKNFNVFLLYIYINVYHTSQKGNIVAVVQKIIYYNIFTCIDHCIFSVK
jgi:hypothetical protein